MTPPPTVKGVKHQTDILVKKENLCVECGKRLQARHGVIAYGDDEPWPFDDVDKCAVCFLSREFF